MNISTKIKAWGCLSQSIAAGVAGILGSFIAVGILHWFSFPDHNTIDMLSFTESAFGIGMTVIALVFSLVTVNQVKEIDRRFDEKSKEIDKELDEKIKELDEKIKEFDGQFRHSMEVFAHNSAEMMKKEVKPRQIAASMTQTGFSNITPVTINEPDKEKNKNG